MRGDGLHYLSKLTGACANQVARLPSDSEELRYEHGTLTLRECGLRQWTTQTLDNADDRSRVLSADKDSASNDILCSTQRLGQRGGHDNDGPTAVSDIAFTHHLVSSEVLARNEVHTKCLDALLIYVVDGGAYRRLRTKLSRYTYG